MTRPSDPGMNSGASRGRGGSSPPLQAGSITGETSLWQMDPVVEAPAVEARRPMDGGPVVEAATMPASGIDTGVLVEARPCRTPEATSDKTVPGARARALVRPAGTSFRVALGSAEPVRTRLLTGALAPLLASLAFLPESAPADSPSTAGQRPSRNELMAGRTRN